MEIKAPSDYRCDPDIIELEGSAMHNIIESIPFKLKAEDFISFVEDDMKGSSDRNVVNALGNIKRAIENRMDSLLFAFKYYKLATHWSFPDKMQKLNELGIIAPRILAKINRIRNLLEHQYQIPKKMEVEEAYDVAILFLAYTKRFLTDFLLEGAFRFKGDASKECYLTHEFVKDGLKIELDNRRYNVKATNPHFDKWVKLLISIYY